MTFDLNRSSSMNKQKKAIKQNTAKNLKVQIS